MLLILTSKRMGPKKAKPRKFPGFCCHTVKNGEGLKYRLAVSRDVYGVFLQIVELSVVQVFRLSDRLVDQIFREFD